MKASLFLTSLVIAGAWTSTAEAGCRACSITAPNCGEGYVCAYDEGWGETCCLLETGEPDPDAGPEPTPSPSPWDAGDGGDAGPEPTPSPSPSWDAGDGGDADVDSGSDTSNCRYVCEGNPDSGDAGTSERCWVCDKPDAGSEGGGEGRDSGNGGGGGNGGEGGGNGGGNSGEGGGNSGEGGGGGGAPGGNSNNAGSTARSVAGRPRDRGGCQDSELPPAQGLPPLALLALWGLRRRAARP